MKLHIIPWDVGHTVKLASDATRVGVVWRRPGYVVEILDVPEGISREHVRDLYCGTSVYGGQRYRFGYAELGIGRLVRA